MPKGRKKKALPPLENNLQAKNIVQKSKPLFSLWKSELTLSEFKILDTYLSRIDSHKPEQREVVFEKGKLEELLNVKKINKADLEARLIHLQSTTVDIANGKKLDRITLFERSQAEQDEHGIWKVSLTCTPSALKYIFNVEKLGYLRYKIRCITNIKSLYSYILFTYLEYNRFRQSWEISLEELKDVLNCTDETYKEFKRFNDLILKKCHKELHEKTSLKYTYEPIKKGRSVVAVRFTLETLPKLCIENEQYTLECAEQTDRNEICNGFSHSIFDDFSDKDLRILKELAWSKKRDSDVERHNEIVHDINLACECAVTDFLREKIIVAKSKNPTNLFAYVKKMVENSK